MTSVLLSGSSDTASVKVVLNCVESCSLSFKLLCQVRLLDQEGRTELGSLVAGYSSDYQVVRHLLPPIPINLATTSLLMDCTSPHCSALLTVHPDPGVVSCTSLAGSGQDKIKTQCLTSSQVRRSMMMQRDCFLFPCTHDNLSIKGGCG